MASGNARPARKNITDETSRLTSSQKATAEIRASAEVRGAPFAVHAHRGDRQRRRHDDDHDGQAEPARAQRAEVGVAMETAISTGAGSTRSRSRTTAQPIAAPSAAPAADGPEEAARREQRVGRPVSSDPPPATGR
jgi:hypothetical protein